jgi:hypothetical protein
MALLEEGIDPITFKNYPHSSQYLQNLRSRLYTAIKEKV